MSPKQLKLYTGVLIGLLLNALGCGLDNIGNVKSEIVSSYLVLEITPAYAKAGDAITLKGTGFDSKMQVKVGGQAPEKVSFISSEEIVVLLPKDLVGLVTIIVSKDDESNKSSYLILPSQGVLLNVTEVENDVCDGQEFFTVSGKKKTGTKLCNTTSDKDPLEIDPLEKDPLETDPRLDAGSDPSTDPAPVASILPDCDAQTVTNCRASTSYPAVSKTLLQASDIRKDVIIGPLGLTGTLVSPPKCSGMSGEGCIATAAYPSIDKTIIDPAKMLDTLTLAGVTGTIVSRGNWNLSAAFPGAGYYSNVSNLPVAGDIRSSVNIIGVTGNLTPAPSNCAADGATNCVAIPTFTAATTTGLADKVLSGQTVAGVPGNVTLPAIGKVLTGTDYGITGNGSAGTLTLPAASNVLGGSGNYGDPGAPVTPLMSNRGIWNLTSGFPGAGYYSSVSNAPLAGDIRSTVNIIGVLGNVTPTPSNCAADGAINCVAIPRFKAANTANLADKVLFGQTVAGASGNVTLPAIGKVLTGTNYGIAGNGSSGVLTLPAASNVLSGSGIYGDPGSPVAPLMANKGVWNLTTPFQGAGYYSNVTNVPITTNIKSGIQILGETGTYSGTPLDNCNADGQSSCIASASFPSADVSSKAIPSNIRKGTSIAGVTGNYVGGGEYIVINEPSSFNDAINLNGNFTIHFTAFDSNTANRQVTLYFRLDNNSGCSGIPSNNGWSIITDTLSEDDTSYVWNTTGQPAGYYFVCAQYDANTTKYFTSVSSLAIGIPGSCIAADGVTWRNEGGGCAFYNGPTITIFSTAEIFNRSSSSANTRCSDLIEGEKNDWVLINANLIEAAAYGHAVNQIVGIASGSRYWGTSNRCTLMSSTAPSIDPSCSNERTVCGRTP